MQVPDITTSATLEVSDPDRLPRDPVVSVVMLAYAHEATLAEAIESVLAQQTNFTFELIIGEDCSPDQTRAIALEYQRRHPQLIRVLYADANVGAFGNSGRVIRAARGRYVSFCEGDDYWHHLGKLQMQVDAMEAEPSISLVHTDYDRQIGDRIRRNVHATDRPTHLAAGADAYVSMLHRGTVRTATMMVRKDVLDEFLHSPYNRADWPFGDYTKALFASLVGHICYLPVSTATWRKVAGSATNAGARQRLRLGLALEECRRVYMSDFPVAPEVERAVIGAGHLRLLPKAFGAGDTATYLASWRWLKANGFHPSLSLHCIRRMALALRFPIALLSAVRRVMLVANATPVRVRDRRFPEIFE